MAVNNSGFDSHNKPNTSEWEEHYAVADVSTGRRFKGVQLIPQKIFVDTVSSSEQYIGYTKPGTAEDAPLWRIVKITVSGSVKKTEFAGGEDTFVNRWDQRVTLSYS